MGGFKKSDELVYLFLLGPSSASPGLQMGTFLRRWELPPQEQPRIPNKRSWTLKRMSWGSQLFPVKRSVPAQRRSSRGTDTRDGANRCNKSMVKRPGHPTSLQPGRRTPDSQLLAAPPIIRMFWLTWQAGMFPIA